MPKEQYIEEAVKELRKKFTDDSDGSKHPFEQFLRSKLSEMAELAIEAVIPEEKSKDHYCINQFEICITCSEMDGHNACVSKSQSLRNKFLGL